MYILYCLFVLERCRTRLKCAIIVASKHYLASPRLRLNFDEQLELLWRSEHTGAVNNEPAHASVKRLTLIRRLISRLGRLSWQWRKSGALEHSRRARILFLGALLAPKAMPNKVAAD